ncbi:hypothetical protein T439DRAFT_326556 [Meredithblackwellia eburnea MCA 4105]
MVTASTPEILEQQLSTLEVLQSILSLEGELTLDPQSAAAIPILSDLPSSAPPFEPLEIPEQLPSELTFIILVSLESSSALPEHSNLRVTVNLPLSSSNSVPHISLHQPTWLSRSQHKSLSQELEQYISSNEATLDDGGGGSQFILDALEWLRNRGREALEESTKKAAIEDATSDQIKRKTEGKLVRVWFWLPSLSTKEKRNDIVNWAPEFDLTGFVLAGKPALLCVEGIAENVDSYMNDIKSVSWADIPSFQKKISERHRTPLLSSESRAFSKMEEITHLVDKGGARGNRGEMGQVRDWLIAKGLGDAFGLVIGGGSFSS